MIDEHFGIAVVELMAAGVIVVAHDSAGPAQDIIGVSPKTVGFLGKTPEGNLFKNIFTFTFKSFNNYFQITLAIFKKYSNVAATIESKLELMPWNGRAKSLMKTSSVKMSVDTFHNFLNLTYLFCF